MLINGTSANDNLNGTEENDTLNGGTGDDTILGSGGNDLITFGAGAKTVNGEEGDDLVEFNFSEESANFTLLYNGADGSVTSEGILNGTRIEKVERFNLSSGSGNDNINISGASLGSEVNSGAGNDNILGGNGDDDLDGSSGNDTINGGEKNDSIDGGIGNDILNGESGNDLITFGEGEKTVNGGGGRDRLDLDFAGESADFTLTYNRFEGASLTNRGGLRGTRIEAIEQLDVTSGAGDDLIDIATARIGSVVSSGEGNDSLIGGRGDDELFGRGDNDTFFGGSGSDQINGGAGNNDVAVYLGDREDFEITVGENNVTVASDSNTDTLTNIEFIRFDDGDFNLAEEEFVSIDAESSSVEAESTSSTRIENVNGKAIALLSGDGQTQFYTTEETESGELLASSSAGEFSELTFSGVEAPSEQNTISDPINGFDSSQYSLSTGNSDISTESANFQLEGIDDGTAFYEEAASEI